MNGTCDAFFLLFANNSALIGDMSVFHKFMLSALMIHSKHSKIEQTARYIWADKCHDGKSVKAGLRR